MAFRLHLRLLRLAVPLFRFWYVRGYLTEGRRWLEQALVDASSAPASLRRRALTAAAAIALPVGALIGHTGRGKQLAVTVSGGLRALPTLGALTLFGLWLGIGLPAPVIALVILAVPPILAGAYAGFESVDRSTIDATPTVQAQAPPQPAAPPKHAVLTRAVSASLSTPSYLRTTVTPPLLLDSFDGDDVRVLLSACRLSPPAGRSGAAPIARRDGAATRGE